MKKLAFIILLLLPLSANASKYQQEDPLLQDEIDSIYKTMKDNLRGIVRLSSASAASLTVTSATINLATISSGTIPSFAVTGTATNNEAPSGRIGEFIETIVSVSSNSPPNGSFGDFIQMPLTAGDWELIGRINWNSNGATWSQVVIGIGTAIGTSGVGMVSGYSRLDEAWANSATTPLQVSQVCVIRVSLSGSATYRLKYAAVYSAGQPQALGALSARRMR